MDHRQSGRRAEGNFSQVDSRPSDSSVQALRRFPDVMAMLADHLDWNRNVGHGIFGAGRRCGQRDPDASRKG
jgi:hypothetical protein